MMQLKPRILLLQCLYFVIIQKSLAFTLTKATSSIHQNASLSRIQYDKSDWVKFITTSTATRSSSTSRTTLSREYTTMRTSSSQINFNILKLGFVKGFGLVIMESWWCLPLLTLGLYPIYCLLHQSPASMPTWWAMNNITYLKTNTSGLVTCIGFLLSNIFYILSGLYLINRKPYVRALGFPADSRKFNAKKYTAQSYLLGIFVILCGFVSAVYHSFQALGSQMVAESLCFVDHGFALSAFCYFLSTCGFPTMKTLSVGLVSMIFLIFPGDVYPIMHSIWHFSSACTSVQWAMDGVQRRKKYIATTVKSRRNNLR